jgi:hypothetical protein
MAGLTSLALSNKEGGSAQDEAHTLVGYGGYSYGGDAGKYCLARLSSGLGFPSGSLFNLLSYWGACST